MYAYDGESRRVRIQELESSVQTKDETFAWCESRICQKRSGSTVVRSYFENGFEQSGPGEYFYTRDLGSVREVVAGDGTTVASRLSYDPSGEVTESGSVLSDFAFTGHYFDRPSALGLTWYRGYDPHLARWLSMDPIGLNGGFNLYAYVGGDPIDRVDSEGRGWRLFQACMLLNMGNPLSLAICAKEMAKPDPVEFPACANLPNKLKDWCCQRECNWDPKKQKRRKDTSCPYDCRAADPDRMAEACWTRCMTE